MTDRFDTDGEREDLTGAQDSELSYELDEDEPPSEAVVRATAALTNRSVVDLDPLFDEVDPDHLDGLFGGRGDGPGTDGGSVTFPFNGCSVTVTSQQVVVRAADDGTD